MSNIHIRVKDKTKKSASRVLNRMGIDMSTAITMYLHQIIITQTIPFRLVTENGLTLQQKKEILQASEEAGMRKNVTEAKTWKDAKKHLDSLKKKKWTCAFIRVVVLLLDAGTHNQVYGRWVLNTQPLSSTPRTPLFPVGPGSRGFGWGPRIVRTLGPTTDAAIYATAAPDTDHWDGASVLLSSSLGHPKLRFEI